MDTADIVIIGAGVVGLAIAAEIARRNPDRTMLVIEQHERCGQETSSRNSEVIHAGMYYPTGSLKARMCVEGNRLLYDYCSANGIPHERLGKLIVARDEFELPALAHIMEQGAQNKVPGLRMLGAQEVRHMEPEVTACGAIFSATTGIVDTHRLMMHFEVTAASRGVIFVYGHTVVAVEPVAGGYRITYRSPHGRQGELAAACIINCAGLGCERVAAAMGIDTAAAGYTLHYCKGEYFKIPLLQARRIRHLIYPPPFRDMRGLGIHVARRLDGSVSLGPSAFYVDSIDYRVDQGHARQFFESAHPYLPFLSEDDLQPDMAGIRPKLQAPGGPVRDFVIRHEADRGLPGVTNLIGIESPGLTSCLSIARLVTGMLAEQAQRRRA